MRAQVLRVLWRDDRGALRALQVRARVNWVSYASSVCGAHAQALPL